MQFNPARLYLARRRRGMTRLALAQATGMTRRTLYTYHSGSREPDDATLEKLGRALRFPVPFFYGQTLEEPPFERSSFRALSSLSATRREQALAAGALGLCLADWIDKRFTLPAPDIPAYRGKPPEVAAMKVRRDWNLGQRPIENVIHLLELHGVRVYSLREEIAAIDAYSFWRGEIPYVFLNTMKTGERSRMDAAHELGHLVLHGQDDLQRGRQAEREAQEFGAAFLMPRMSVCAHRMRLRAAGIARIKEAKHHWKVSIASLIYRMHQVGLLTDRQYHHRFQTISRRGWRKKEPEPSSPEGSQVLHTVFQRLIAEGTTPGKVAEDLNLYPDELNKMLFHFVLMPVDTL